MSVPLFEALTEWTGDDDPNPEPSRFRATFDTTWTDLAVELDAVEAEYPTIRVVCDPRCITRDGRLRTDAKVQHRGVVVEFGHPVVGQVTYACARFATPFWRAEAGPAWHHNLRAITLALFDLRRLERYGITDRAQQYAGFRAIGSGIPMDSGAKPMSDVEAADLLAEHCGIPAKVLLGDRELVAPGYRRAAKRVHPDRGGDPDLFRRLHAAYTQLKP